MAATKTSLTRANGASDELATNEGLPNLFSRLGDDVMQLFNSQLALFKVEIKEEAKAYARGVTMVAIRAVKFQPAGQLRSRFCSDWRLLSVGGRDRRDAHEEPARQTGSGTAENSSRT